MPDYREPNDFRDALNLIRDPGFLKSLRFQEQQTRAVREGAHPDIVEFSRCLIREMGKHGVPMFAHCMIRSLEQQAKEYAEGDSKVKYGAHNVGMAVDMIHGTRAWKLTRASWSVIGHVGNEIVRTKGLRIVSLAWGGDWGFYDPAHWEIDGWRDLAFRFPFPKYIMTEKEQKEFDEWLLTQK